MLALNGDEYEQSILSDSTMYNHADWLSSRRPCIVPLRTDYMLADTESRVAWKSAVRVSSQLLD